jgi:hypothetical protein
MENTDTTRIADGLIRVDRSGSAFLGVSTGIPTNSPTLRKLAGKEKQAGILVHNGQTSDWYAQGFTEQDGRIFVYGPYLEGRMLETALEDTGANRFASLRIVAEALQTLIDKGHPAPVIHTRSILVTRDAGVLFLPPHIMQAVREHQTYDDRIKTMERFRHPDRSASENLAFFLAAASYYVICGRYPYDADNEEELHARVRSKTLLPPQVVDVTITDEVNVTIEKALKSSEQQVTLPDWISLLRKWERDGVREEIGEEVARARAEKARQISTRIEKGFRRREGIRKNGKTAIIIAAIVLVVGSIPATIISNALQPRETAGFPPEEVVQAFYDSFTTLDHMTMEDTLIDDAGQRYVREVTNLFVIDRQRIGAEGRSGFADAQQWRDEGMPPLEPTINPYGIAELSIEEQSAGPNERVYIAEFERWRPDYEAAQEGSNRIEGVRERQRLSLRTDDEDWVIYDIETLSTEPIDVEELRASSQ